MKLFVLSDEKIFFDGEASEVNSFSENGPFKIMDHHIPYISKIQSELSFTARTSGETTKIEIKEGFLYTNGDSCVAVIDSASFG